MKAIYMSKINIIKPSKLGLPTVPIEKSIQAEKKAGGAGTTPSPMRRAIRLLLQPFSPSQPGTSSDSDDATL